MTKRKLTKYEDDVRRNLRKSAEINPAQSPHNGIHTCSKGCKKQGCNRGLRDTIEEQNAQIESLKQDLLEKTAAVRQVAQDNKTETEATRIENARLQAEVERLTSDLQMEKENKDRLVREWQKANNEVYGLQTQVAALIDDQTRLKAEVERLDTLCKQMGKQHSDISCENITLRKAGDALLKDNLNHFTDHTHNAEWNAAKEGKQS